MTKELKPFHCAECGQLDKDFPVYCKHDQEDGGEYLDTTTDDEFMQGGYLCWYGYCRYSGEEILLQEDELDIDESNTAHYLDRWAKEQELALEFDVRDYSTFRPARRGSGYEYKTQVVMTGDAIPVSVKRDETGWVKLHSKTHTACIKEVRQILGIENTVED